ncbi:hypothetical protein K9M48_04140 [Candidatus Gracilibacteria bacterium]|nr:hypothetical protein [Candidatus Gracilibacteria bacterium]
MNKRLSLFQKITGMKLAIITSGNENLSLFKFLNKYDHEYIIYYDFLYRPYGDKDSDFIQNRVVDIIKFLKKSGVEKIILPPSLELYFLSNPKLLGVHQSLLLPLFQTYLHDYCFKYSIIGKIGAFGDFSDIQIIQDLLKQEEKSYSLTDNQKSIKKFHSPFKYRTKEVPMRKYYLTTLSYSDFMINKIIKFDMRYFKDAMVDTVIPLNYGYFNFQNTLTKFFNFKKIRFHKLEKLEDSFVQLTSKLSSDKYSITMYHSGPIDLFQKQKKLVRLLARGKNIEINYEKI